MDSLPSSSTILQEATAATDGQDNADKHCRALILQTVLYGTTPHDSLTDRTKQACKVLTEILVQGGQKIEDRIVDALWLRGCTIPMEPHHTPSATATSDTPSSPSAAKTSMDALVSLIQSLVQESADRQQTLISKLQSNLMPQILGGGNLSSEQDLLKRLKMYNTQINYKQQKYNLLQEETEGFSKVVHFLSDPSTIQPEQRIQHLDSLIGTFELDPHRVMDLIIDVLECTLYPKDAFNNSKSLINIPNLPEKNEHVGWLLGLLKNFSLDALPSLIAFKLTNPDGLSDGYLYTVALLVAEGLLNLEILINKYSPPIQSQLEEAHKVLYMTEKRRVQALTRVSLSGATNSIKEDPKFVELSERLQTLLKPLKDQPVLSILLVLLKWGEWTRIRPLLLKQSWNYLCDLLPESFGFAFCDIAEERIKPFHQANLDSPGLLSPWHAPRTMISEKAEEFVSIDEFLTAISEPLLCTLNSGCLSARPILFCQLCRVIKVLAKRNQPQSVPSDELYDFISGFMVPALSFFPSNPALSSELWSVLEMLPYTTRYRLYDDWKGSGLEKAGMSSSHSTGKPLFVTEAELEAGKAARYALKRLSKDNIRDMSRQLAKVSNCCPLVVYGTILNQIESYDNLVEVMVEAQRFTNPLGLDVLGYCILSRLSGTSGGVNRSRLKEDGVNVSQWLQSLESFVGAFYKRFPSVELRGILAYLLRRLQNGYVMELGILRTLLKVPGGYTFADYSPVASLSSVQLEGRAGTVTLKRETMSFGIADDINDSAAESMKKVLQTSGVGVSMLILIAHARERLIFETSKGASMPVKLVGNLYDSCQVLMSILLEFLTTQGTASDEPSGQQMSALENYAQDMPTVGELYDEFGFDTETVWMLCRPLVRSIAQSKDTKHPPVFKQFELTPSFRDVYKRMIPDISILTPELFECFFMHNLYDIFCPVNLYSAELSRIGKEIERLERAKSGANSGKSENQELSRLKQVSETLTTEQDRHKEHVAVILSMLEDNMSTFFSSSSVSRLAAQGFLTHCVYRRSLQSPDDAMFSAHLAFKLHFLGTPGFGTLHYLDELISVVSGSLFGLTESEAANVAILLWETWKIVNKWRYEDGLFDSEVFGKPGSFMEVADSDTEGASEAKEITKDEFVTLYNSWHASLGAALIGCLQSAEYMHMRSGLSVLTRIVEVFPTRPKLGNKLFEVLKPLQDEASDRPDIRASANAYASMLVRARDDGKWIEEDAAVAQARADKEKAAAEQRKKKLEEQFDELQRDSEKITEEIGPRDRFERRRDGPDQGGFRSQDQGRVSNMGGSRETGEIAGRDRRSPARERRKDERENGEGKGHRGESSGPPNGRGDNGRGDRYSSERNRRDDGERGARNEDQRSLQGRWVRGDNAGGDGPKDTSRNRGSKRGRGHSPDGGSDERGAAKKARVVSDNYESRRDTGRGSSSRSGADPPRSSRTRRNRR